MSNNANIIHFQCPRCGHELEQTIGLLKAERQVICDSCRVEIHIDSAKVATATETLHTAITQGPNEITIKFYR